MESIIFDMGCIVQALSFKQYFWVLEKKDPGNVFSLSLHLTYGIIVLHLNGSNPTRLL